MRLLLSWLILAGLGAIILVLASKAGLPQFLSPQYQPIESFAKHMAAYGGLGFFVAALLYSGKPPSSLLALAVTVCVCACMGMIDEFRQISVANRGAEVADWIADLTGGIAGGLSFLVVRAGWASFRKSRPQARQPQTRSQRGDPGPASADEERTEERGLK